MAEYRPDVVSPALGGPLHGEPADARTPGRFAYDGLARVIHEKARLSILTSLLAHADGLLFNDLKDLCSLTDGNLSRHLAMLQDAHLVEVWKGNRNNRPQTLVRLTDDGRERFIEYLQVLESVIADAATAAARSAAPRLATPKGFSPA